MADQDWGEIQRISDPGERASAISHKVDEMVANNDRDIQALIWEQQQQKYEDEKSRRRAGIRSGVSDQLQYQAGVGKFYLPEANSLAAHRQIVCDDQYNIGFSPKNYPYFDNIIEMTFADKAAMNPNHRDHAKYEALRDNIAIVRNYILTQMFPGGSGEGASKEQLQLLATMANEIGNALQADRQWIHTPWRHTIKLSEANKPGTGAAVMYETLLQIQKRTIATGPLDALAVGINFVRRKPSRAFGLPALEDSPFGETGLSAPPPSPPGGDGTDNGPPSPPDGPSENSPGILLAEIAAEIGARAQRFEDIESLDEPVRQESVEHARNILQNFRITGEKGGVAAMMLQSTENQLTQANSISVLTSAFEQAVRKAAQSDTAFLNRPEIKDARDAMGHLAWFMNVQALEALKNEGHFGSAKIVAQQIKAFPDEWKQHPEITLEKILAKIEAGLEVADNEITFSDPYINGPAIIAQASLSGEAQPQAQAPQAAYKMQQKAQSDLAMDAQAQTQKMAAKALSEMKKDSTAVDKNSAAAAQVDQLFSKNSQFKNVLKTGAKITTAKPVAPTKLDEKLLPAAEQVAKR